MRRCVMDVGLIKSSILASILIGFGVAALLTLGTPLGPIVFSFGLISVCVLKANLFTGKAGFYWRDKKLELLYILAINLIAGWLIGVIIRIANEDLVVIAQQKIATWEMSWSYFVKSVLCGMIMYIAVRIYQSKNFLGIIYGIPLFIFCGFQHCIANVIILGVAMDFSWILLISIIGNLFGSILINLLED